MHNNSQIPGKLKLELFCKGARIHANCDLEQDTRPVKRTRGGLGSGLDAVLPGNTWVNIPVAEGFAYDSLFWINKVNGAYALWKGADRICDLELPPRPGWYDHLASSGKRLGSIGVMQGTYFAVYPSRLCDFWTNEPGEKCRFCSVGLCHGKTESEEKSVRDVVEAVKAARRHEGITFVHFNTGFCEDDQALEVVIPYVEAVKQETGLLVGVQCPPAIDLAKYDRLRRSGADHVSLCFEIFDPDRFREICPGKARAFGNAAAGLRNDPLFVRASQMAACRLQGRQPHSGQTVFFRALMYAVKLWGKGPVAGEIIAGLEPPESSMAAIDFLADLGAVTTVCVFRPCVGTDLEHEPPPKPRDLEPVLARMHEACVTKSIPYGIAPNIRTAMVHLPEEGAHCAAAGHGIAGWRARLHAARCKLMAVAFRGAFAWSVARRSPWRGLIPVPAILLVILAGVLMRQQRRNTTVPRPVPVSAATDPVANVEYSRLWPNDPGTITVYLRNPGLGPMRIRRVLLAGRHVPVWGVDMNDARLPDENRTPGARPDPGRRHGVFLHNRLVRGPSVWARMEPPVIPVSGIGRCMIKTSAPVVRNTRLELVTAGDATLKIMVRPRPARLVITAVTFAPDLRRVYVYARSRSREPLQVSGIEVDGADTAAWMSSRSIAREGLFLAILRPAAPLKTGRMLCVGIRCRGGWSAFARVRVITGFPLESEDRRPHPGFGLDRHIYTLRPEQAAHPAGGTAGAGASAPEGYYLMACPIHRFKQDWQRCAREIMAGYDRLAGLDPRNPCFIHICRARCLLGYALFAGLADVVRINPNIAPGLPECRGREPDFQKVAAVCARARLATGPRQLHCVVHTTKFGSTRGYASPRALRERVYAILGQGAKGLFYRHRGWNDPLARGINDEIRALNAVVMRIRSLLAVAEVVDWAGGSRQAGKTAAMVCYSLLVADRAVLIFCLPASRVDAERTGSGSRGITLELPAWLEADGAELVEARGNRKLKLVSTGLPAAPGKPAGNALKLRFVVPGIPSCVLVHTRRVAP